MFRDSSSDNYGVRNDGTDILFNGTGMLIILHIMENCIVHFIIILRK